MPTQSSRLLSLALILGVLPLSIARAQPNDEPDRPGPPPPPPRMESGPDDDAPGPDRGPPPRRPGRDTQGGSPRNAPLDARGFRDALKVIVDHMRESAPRLQKAVDDLDTGRPFEDVRRELTSQRSENAAAFMEALRRVGFTGAGFARRNGPELDDGPGGPGGPGGERPDASGPPRPDRPGPGRQFTPEDRTRIVGEITKHNPDLAAQIKTLRDKSPEAADRVIDSLAERTRGMRELEQRDPETFQLRQREIKSLFDVLRLRREYADAVRDKAAEPALTDLCMQLRVAVAEQWDVKAKLDDRQIVDLEKRLERLRQDKLAKAKNRDTTITDRTDSIIRESVNPPRTGQPGGRAPARERRDESRPPRPDAPPPR